MRSKIFKSRRDLSVQNLNVFDDRFTISRISGNKYEETKLQKSEPVREKGNVNNGHMDELLNEMNKRTENRQSLCFSKKRS